MKLRQVPSLWLDLLSKEALFDVTYHPCIKKGTIKLWTPTLDCCRWEAIDSVLQRPIVRRPDKGVIFTRIKPQDKITSMIVRQRPGWEEMRAGLLGFNLSKSVLWSQHITLFVCQAIILTFEDPFLHEKHMLKSLLSHSLKIFNAAFLPCRGA